MKIFVILFVSASSAWVFFHLNGDEVRIKAAYEQGIAIGYRDGYVYGELDESRKRSALRDELFDYFSWYIKRLEMDGVDPSELERDLRRAGGFAPNRHASNRLFRQLRIEEKP